MTTSVWGIVNVTPDSFSDGGEHIAADAAVAHARTLIAAGATVIDVGGESTRPGAVAVGAREEQQRVLPIIEQLAAETIISVDTYHARTAAASIAAGAQIINDVSGGLAEPELLDVVAESTASIAIGHWRGPSADMYALAEYDDVVAEVIGELRARVEAAREAGISRDRIIVDPGLGFAKRGEQNWEVLRALPRIVELGYPVLVGASRKRFLREAIGGDDRAHLDAATAVTSVLAVADGAWGVRVHDVASTVSALAVASAWNGER